MDYTRRNWILESLGLSRSSSLYINCPDLTQQESAGDELKICQATTDLIELVRDFALKYAPLTRTCEVVKFFVDGLSLLTAVAKNVAQMNRPAFLMEVNLQDWGCSPYASCELMADIHSDDGKNISSLEFGLTTPVGQRDSAFKMVINGLPDILAILNTKVSSSSTSLKFGELRDTDADDGWIYFELKVLS